MGFGTLRALYRHHFRDHRRERMFLASVAFFFTFGVSRFLTHSFRDSAEPLRVVIGGTHVHHYVWGILVLLIVGYLWLIQVGTSSRSSLRLGRLTAALYGLGAALTLDEFSLWLHLEDVYWEAAGQVSVDVAISFGGLVSAGLWGGPFWRALICRVLRPIRRRR